MTVQVTCKSRGTLIIFLTLQLCLSCRRGDLFSEGVVHACYMKLLLRQDDLLKQEPQQQCVVPTIVFRSKPRLPVAINQTDVLITPPQNVLV